MYCRCMYCGKPTCVNPEYWVTMPYCNLGCNFKFQDDGALTEEERDKNYTEALPAFEATLEKWRQGWKERMRTKKEE